MKKEYISPAILAMRVETISMIAASIDKGEEILNDAEYEKSWLSREQRGSLWDDDEEDF